MTSTGALIMGTFATIWWIVGLRSAGHGPALVYLPPLLVAAMLGGLAQLLARRGGAAQADATDSVEQARRDRLVAWASAGEGLALFLVAGVVLPSTGHREATAPMIAIIVGLHFVPLARGLPASAYYVTAAILTVLGLLGFAISDLHSRVTIVSAGAAIVLWLTASAVLRRAGESRPTTIHSAAS